MSRLTYALTFPKLAGQALANEFSSRFASLKTLFDKAMLKQGAWNTDTLFTANDVTTSGGFLWLALQDSQGVTPVEGVYWTQLSGGGGGAIADGSITNAKLGAGIDAAKLADGSISNAEFQALNGITGAIQPQLNARPTLAQIEALLGESYEPGDNITFTTDPDSGKVQISATGDLAATLGRADVAVSTAPLQNGQTDATKLVALGRSAWVIRVTTDRPAWVRLYTSAAALSADAGRARDVWPSGEHGLVFDVVTRDDNLDIPLAPMAQAANLESPTSPNYPLSVVSLASGTAPVLVTITKLTIEI